jgi:SAM-dependent methyltransferase
MPQKLFLEREFERNTTDRQKIVNRVLVPYLKPTDRILDVGCGPGFLAKNVSPHVKLVYACDISKGVLACAGVINGAPNIRYIYSGDSGFAQIPDGSLDLAYSFAVIQHVREAIIKSLFEVVSKKVCPGGQCLFQVQLDDGKWKSESECVQDKSFEGQLKLKYALNFFSRSEKFFQDLAQETGFSVTAIRPMSELLDKPFDDVYYQHLIVLTRK